MRRFAPYESLASAADPGFPAVAAGGKRNEPPLGGKCKAVLAGIAFHPSGFQLLEVNT